MTLHLLGTKLGNYRLERLLGRGRMGVVYLARDEALLRPTAVKILSWSMPEQQGQSPEAWFLAEARNVARVNHPNVVQIYGVAKHGAHCYIAMEYVPGGPADAWLERHGPFSPERATEILLQAASALQAAHDAEVVHRDVKPGNLLIAPDGTAKLGDFGMALHMPACQAADAVRAGTPFYTAPEIWLGAPATPATDIYALGATYFYLLTGRPPFEAQDLPGLIQAHLTASVPDLRNLCPQAPPGCAEIILRCLAKSAPDRYPSAQQVAWEGRGVLRDFCSMPPSFAKTPAPLAVAEEPASELASTRWWAESLGFVSRPFTGPASGGLSVGEPFASLREQIAGSLRDGQGHVVLLLGEPGSGRTTIADQVLADCEPGAQVARLTRDEEPGQFRSLHSRVLRAFGVAAPLSSSPDADINRLLEHLDVCHGGAGASTPRALLVLDNLKLASAHYSEVHSLLRAAAATRYFRILWIGATALGEELAHRGWLRQESWLPVFHLPPLSGPQTLNYLRDSIAHACPPHRAPVLVTPDAAMLVAHRTQGNLARINRLALNMLRLAGAEKRRVLTSWDAWIMPLEEQLTGAIPAVTRPRDWPTTEVARILNEQRRKASIEPLRLQGTNQHQVCGHSGGSRTAESG